MDVNLNYYNTLKSPCMAAVDDDGKMIFVTKEEDGKFKTINGLEYQLSAGQKAEIIEVLAYRRLEFINGEIIEKESQMITPDADQLVAGVKNPNYGDILVKTPKNLPDEFSTEPGHTITAALKYDTAGNNLISHSAETYNPTPEKWSNANHVFFIPSGDEIRYEGKDTELDLVSRTDLDIKIVHNESEALALFNAKRAEGYNMPVNPEWGWRVNPENKLEIDPNRGLAETRYNQKLRIQSDYGENSPQYADSTQIELVIRRINQLQVLPYEEQPQTEIEESRDELHNLEAEFKQKYNIYSPTEFARKKEQNIRPANSSINELKEEKSLDNGHGGDINIMTSASPEIKQPSEKIGNIIEFSGELTNQSNNLEIKNPNQYPPELLAEINEIKKSVSADIKDLHNYSKNVTNSLGKAPEDRGIN